MTGAEGSVGAGNAGRSLPAGRSPLAVTLAVWRALFLREAVARLAGRAAWLWLLLEPIAHVAFLMVLFSYGVRDRSIPGVEFALFLALGIIGFQVFSSAAKRSMAAIGASGALFTFRQVKPVDTVLVRCFLEGVLKVVVFVVLMTGAAVLGVDVLPHDPLLLLVAFANLWLLGLGLGLLLSVGGGLVPEIEKVAGIIFMPLYFASGVMFRPEMAPPGVREWLLNNPILHAIETLRVATFPAYHPLPEINLVFPLLFAVLTIFFGLALHIRFEGRLAAR